MNNNSEYLTDTYHILGENVCPLTKHILTLQKEIRKMFTLLLYQVKIYII